MAAFRKLFEAQARNSSTREPGCPQFDVCSGGEDKTHRYEFYADDAAFQDHLARPHFKKFDKAIAPLVAAKEVRTFPALFEGTAGRAFRLK